MSFFIVVLVLLLIVVGVIATLALVKKGRRGRSGTDGTSGSDGPAGAAGAAGAAGSTGSTGAAGSGGLENIMVVTSDTTLTLTDSPSTIWLSPGPTDSIDVTLPPASGLSGIKFTFVVASVSTNVLSISHSGITVVGSMFTGVNNVQTVSNDLDIVFSGGIQTIGDFVQLISNGQVYQMYAVGKVISSIVVT